MTTTLLKETKIIDVKEALDKISSKREELNNQVEIEIGDNLIGFLTVSDLKSIFSHNDEDDFCDTQYINEGWE